MRRLWRDRLHTLLNIGGLSVGMAAALLVLLWVQNEWSFDRYHQKAAQTYRILSHIKVSADEIWNWSTTPMGLVIESAKKVPEIQQFARFKKGSEYSVFKIEAQLFKEKKYAYVDNNWFELFDYQFVEGSARDALNDPKNIVLTEAKAQQLFGKRDPIGKVIRIDTLDFVVKAIIKNNPANSSLQFDYLIPIEAYLANPDNYKNDSRWGNFGYNAFVSLHKNADANKVAQKITAVLRENRPGDSTSTNTLQALPAMHFDRSLMSDTFVPGNPNTVRIFAIIGILILLIACINYVSLTTAKASSRAKEVSIKKIIGAHQSSLFRQFMTESILLSALAMILALGLVKIGLQFFNNLMQTPLELNVSNGSIWLVFALIGIGTVLLTGIYPSILLSSFQPIKLLRGLSWVGGNNATFRKSLVVLQFTISIILIISTIVIYNQMQFIKQKDLGFDKENIFSITFPYNIFNGEDRAERMNTLLTFQEKLSTQASVTAVATASESLVNNENSSSGNLDWAGKAADYNPTVMQMSADLHFQKLCGLQLVAGRWFEAANEADKNNLVLNESATRALQLKKPYIGQQLTFQGRPGEVIGIVKDFHYRSMHEPIMPAVICNQPDWRGKIFVKTTPEQTAQALATTEKLWKELVPQQPFEYTFEDELFAKLYENDQRTGKLFNIFAGIAIFISCLGLFGLVTYTAERRTKEIGIRKVLGASVSNIVTLLSKDFLGLVMLAAVVAFPLAWYFMNQWLQDFAYRIHIQWWVFLLAGMVALGIAFLTVSAQAIRAAVANPVKSLRID